MFSKFSPNIHSHWSECLVNVTHTLVEYYEYITGIIKLIFSFAKLSSKSHEK